MEEEGRRLQCDICGSTFDYSEQRDTCFCGGKLKVISSKYSGDKITDKERQDSINEWKQMLAKNAGTDKGNPYGITCPYCKATNIRKIGVVSRSISAGIFGLGSKKIGKQWHCDHCGSDF